MMIRLSKASAATAGRRMVRSLQIVLLALSTLLAGCGGDGFLFISVNLGTVVSAPLCGTAGSQFDMIDASGLVLLVVINSDTNIVTANGQAAQCGDLVRDADVRVRGPREVNTITAQTVQIL